MSRNEIPTVEISRNEIGSYYKSQPNAINLAYTTIPEDEVWTSDPVFAEELAGDAEKQNETFLFELDLDEVKPVVPPDGGWGWMIVLGSFFCMFLVDGVCFSFGILMSELQETFGASKMQMALAGSLLTGCYFMVGPLASGLMNRFGARKLVIIGSVISSLAILAGSFAPDVNTFIGVFGIVGGFGFGLLYLPATTIVTAWFVTKRATVTGLITAGSGIGITCYSLLIPQLIELYSWRGCIFVMAALNLNSAVAGALFRPLIDSQPVAKKSPILTKVPPRSRRTSRTSAIGYSTNMLSVKQLARQVLEAEAARAQTTDEHVSHSNLGLNDMVYRVVPKRESSKKSNTSWDDMVITHGNQLMPVPEGTTLAPATNENLPMISLEAVYHIVDDVVGRSTGASTVSLSGTVKSLKRKSSQLANGSQRWFASTASQMGPVSVKPADTATVYLKPDHMGSNSFFASAISLKTGGESAIGQMDESVFREAVMKEIRKEVARPVHKKDLFLSGSVMQLNEYIASPNVEAYLKNVTVPAEEIQARSPFRAMLMNLFNVSILRSPTFQLLNLSSVLTMIGYIVPYQFLKDNAQRYGYDDKDASHLLAYLGILNTISRVISGLVSDRSWVDIIILNNISLIVAGLLTALVPLFTTYTGLLSYACLFGFIIATFIAVRTILIVKVLGLDRLTNAYGFLLLFQGIAIVAAPPSFGAIYDALQSFNHIFIIGGLTLFVSGLLCLPLKCLVRWEQQKEVRTSELGTEKLRGEKSSIDKVDGVLRRVRDRFGKRTQGEKK